jgi:hypothetical protein
MQFHKNLGNAFPKLTCKNIKKVTSSRHNIEWRVVRRRQYSDELVAWSDLIISAGGDGE